MREIIDMLNANEYFGGNVCIEIAKGKYELPKKITGWKYKIKRYFIKYVI